MRFQRCPSSQPSRVEALLQNLEAIREHATYEEDRLEVRAVRVARVRGAIAEFGCNPRHGLRRSQRHGSKQHRDRLRGGER